MKYQIMDIYVTPNTDTYTKILWVSRHSPLPSQIRELERKLGPIKIVLISGIIPDAETVINVAKREKVSYIVPVLPLFFISKLLALSKGAFVLLWSKMKTIHRKKGVDVDEAYKCTEYNPDTDIILFSNNNVRHKRFVGFEKIKEIKMITEPF